VSPPPDAYELAEARGYGLTASDLRALLVSDGWTLDDATIARFAGVDRYAPAGR
jgi:hypothetical protein